MGILLAMLVALAQAASGSVVAVTIDAAVVDARGRSIDSRLQSSRCTSTGSRSA